MTREEAYKIIFTNILSRTQLTEDEIEEREMSLEFNGIRYASAELLSQLQGDDLKFSPFLRSIIDFADAINVDIVEDLTNLSLCYSLNQFPSSSKRRNFSLSSAEISVFDTKYLVEANHAEPYKECVWRTIEKIVTIEQNHMDAMLDIVQNSEINKYYVVYDTTVFTNPLIGYDFYSLALLKYLNAGNKFPLENSLSWSSITLATPFVPNASVVYSQYMDIYDVIDEMQHSRDVLTAFLKMYQILEFIIYRKKLVEIVNGTTIKNSFLRQVKGLDKSFTSNEKDTFKREFSLILTSFNGLLTKVDAAVENFVSRHFSDNGVSVQKSGIA